MSIEFDDLYSEFRVEEQDLRILKAITSDNTACKDFTSSYDHTLFLGDSQDFAEMTLKHIKTYGSPPSKRVLLETNADKAELINYVCDELDRLPFDKNDFKYDLQKIKSRFTRRKAQSLREALDDIDFSKDSADDELRNIKYEFEKLQQVRSGKRKTYKQYTLAEYLPTFQQDYFRKSQDEDLGQGILTGYGFLDHVKNGMQPAELLIIGGETGAGKSMLLNNMAIQMWMQKNDIHRRRPEDIKPGHNVLYFSLEMPYEMCFRRTMARLANVPIYGLRDCKLGRSLIDNLDAAANFIDTFGSQFEIVDVPRGVNVAQIEERFNEACAKGHRPDVVVVDYLGLMEDDDTSSEDWLKLGAIAGKLHEFARVYEVVVLTAVQLNRPPKSSNKDSSDLIGLHRIGRSSLIMHHANLGVQIESRKDEHTYADMIYHVIKNRDGELGKQTLLKNFANATVIENPESPFIKPSLDDIGSFTSVNVQDDISNYLKNIGWAK